jgi:hypothetical protein
MTAQIPTQPSSLSRPEFRAPGGEPYPDIADTSHATPAAASLLARSRSRGMGGQQA